MDYILSTVFNNQYISNVNNENKSCFVQCAASYTWGNAFFWGGGANVLSSI